jgi:hypothetical protein
MGAAHLLVKTARIVASSSYSGNENQHDRRNRRNPKGKTLPLMTQMTLIRKGSNHKAHGALQIGIY